MRRLSALRRTFRFRRTALSLRCLPYVHRDTASPYSRKNPFPGRIVTNRLLSMPGSGKEIRHFEMSLAGSGLKYETGDSLGVFPDNDPALVEEILAALGATGEETVPGNDGAPVPLRQALRGITRSPSPPSSSSKPSRRARKARRSLRELLADPLRKDDVAKYTYGMEVIDFLLTHPSIHFTPEEFVKLLRKLQPRLYSISSSPKAHPEEVHLTIATVRYESHGRQRKGVASTFLAERAAQPVPVPLFFHSAKHFRLPEDRVAAGHHGRAGHGHRAVPRVPAGAPGDRRDGQELAVLRRPEGGVRLPVPRGTGSDAGRRRARRGSTWRSRATRRRRCTCSTA